MDITKEIIADRIKLVQEENGINQVTLAKLSGISQSQISKIIRKVHLADVITLAKIALALDVSLEWLLTGKGSKYADEKEFLIQNTKSIKNAYRIKKLTKTAEAGITSFDVSQISDNEENEENPIFRNLNWLQQRGFKPQNLVALTIRGDSMQPGLFEGDTVIVNLDDREFLSGHVFALLHEGNLVVKRLKRKSNSYWLCSDNENDPRFHDEQFNETTKIVGKAIQKICEVL